MSSNSHSLNHRWLNLIMHTTAYISKKKQALLTDSVFKTFVDIILIILTEAFLAIISLPLYLQEQQIKLSREEEAQYRLRRFLALSLLLPIIAIWVLKVGLLAINTFYVAPQQDIAISAVSTAKSTTEYRTAEISSSPVNPQLSTPLISEVTVDTGRSLTITGEADQDKEVVVYLSQISENQESFTLHLVQSDTNGDWELTKSSSVFRLSPGEYTASSVIYDSETRSKSSRSPVVHFEVEEPFENKIVLRVDTWLNYLLIAFISISIFLAILAYNLSS